ncbi:MAG: hypothetical protein JOZ66_02230 [Hyphomicrobiales bacterium]|nr:hypothetical protein [Hyphomicrobiales bacterium]
MASLSTMERHLAEAESRIAEGIRHLQRQREIASELERDGHDTTQSKTLCATFETSLAMLLAYRDRLREELKSVQRFAPK